MPLEFVHLFLHNIKGGLRGGESAGGRLSLGLSLLMLAFQDFALACGALELPLLSQDQLSPRRPFAQIGKDGKLGTRLGLAENR